jgi:hypothetical protein
MTGMMTRTSSHTYEAHGRDDSLNRAAQKDNRNMMSGCEVQAGKDRMRDVINVHRNNE